MNPFEVASLLTVWAGLALSVAAAACGHFDVAVAPLSFALCFAWVSMAAAVWHERERRGPPPE